ncbi:sushi domain-containing protein 6 isoform X2 [Pangasianodon hypophthalmus]|uniref:sushi domain-containing protein 6 isoform X2 n=1 Tax=Pangasianodon hypophthalmus TaxID=310915 RepID=UPI000EFFB8D9|nr:sushi domain-containing protein 6 isoform X2 [Pangasianodon hypophthalmus]
MSTHRPPLWPCLQALMGYVVFILTSLPEICTGQNCSHPIIPEHGGFYCKPSPCRGFPPKSRIYYFCESGYVLPNHVHHSSCRKGRWDPIIPTCIPNPAGHSKYEDRVTNSIPSMATTAVGVSIFLLTTTACMVVKSRLYPCQSRRRSSDQVDLMVDGLPVSLPTYDEAVYGSWGQRIPPLHGPTQLLLASSENSPLSSLIQSGSSNCTDTSNQSTEAPPPYEETQPRSVDGGNEGEARASHIALSVEKDN